MAQRSSYQQDIYLHHCRSSASREAFFQLRVENLKFLPLQSSSSSAFCFLFVCLFVCLWCCCYQNLLSSCYGVCMGVREGFFFGFVSRTNLLSPKLASANADGASRPYLNKAHGIMARSCSLLMIFWSYLEKNFLKDSLTFLGSIR